MVPRSSFAPRRKAAATVETALVLPTLLLLLLGTFDFGHYYLMRHRLQATAAEVGRVAIANASTLTTTELQQLARERLVGLADDSLQVSLYQTDPYGNNIGPWQHAVFGARVCVEIRANFRFLTPLFGLLPNEIPIRVKSVQRSEGD